MIFDKIVNDRIIAMKNQDKPRRDVLGLVVNELQKKIKENSLKGNVVISDEDSISILVKMKKQRQESISFYEKANDSRKDQEEYEISVIDDYLPVGKSKEEIEFIIEEVISSSGAKDFKEFGRHMKELRERLGSGVDMTEVVELVKIRLLDDKL